eukprot:325498_1
MLFFVRVEDTSSTETLIAKFAESAQGGGTVMCQMARVLPFRTELYAAVDTSILFVSGVPPAMTNSDFTEFRGMVAAVDFTCEKSRRSGAVRRLRLIGTWFNFDHGNSDMI